MKNYKFKISIFITSIFYFLIFVFYFAEAASSNFLVSWQVKNSVPSWYQGKVLPIRGVVADVAFELIDSGKIVDLSKEKIRWYVNDDLYKNESNGLGIKNISFPIYAYSGNETEVRVEILQYKGGEAFGKIIKIPSVPPEVVIDSPYAGNNISAGRSVFKATPFFFNVKNFSDLSIKWSVMGQEAEESFDPWKLDLDINEETPKNTEINISVLIKNLLKDLEFASKNLKLIVK